MTQQEQAMYGMSEADIRAQHINGPMAQLVGLEMTLMGIMSDAQVMLEFNRPDQARQLMNVSKFILAEMTMKSKKEH